MFNKRASLHNAYKEFAKKRNQQAYDEFLFNFLMLAKEGIEVHIPVEVNENNQMTYGLVHTTGGYYYVVCTDANELKQCPEKSSVVAFLDKIVVRMLNDDEIKGICVNPYSEFPCFIPQEYVRMILK